MLTHSKLAVDFKESHVLPTSDQCLEEKFLSGGFLLIKKYNLRAKESEVSRVTPRRIHSSPQPGLGPQE